jgi:hypothetical protein
MRVSKIIGTLSVLFVMACASSQQKQAAAGSEIQKGLSDSALLDLVQKQTFRYFWDFAHPVSGLARERSNEQERRSETVTTGGTGFGVMAIVVATERKWISRDSAVARLLKMLRFLDTADKFHGVFPHWLNGTTGRTIAFSPNDNGADLVETAFLMQGLLAVKAYFNAENEEEGAIRTLIDKFWREAEWNWFTRDTAKVLYWHWSPDKEWKMNHAIRGWNECLITYVLAASSPTHAIDTSVYHEGWTTSTHFKNGKNYFGIPLPLGFEYGGPLFFAHYSFLGLDPRNLKDRYADYWEQNRNHVLINREYCIKNPKNYKGYSAESWGLTASDNHEGYNAHAPDNDLGVISPTAALSSMPYTPEYSMQALRHFYEDLGGKIWSEYGFVDAFNESKNWYADSHLAIDQGPIIVMIENYRSGLLWKLFMSNQDVQRGLERLGFENK